jgi:hypothetical protein
MMPPNDEEGQQIAKEAGIYERLANANRGRWRRRGWFCIVAPAPDLRRINLAVARDTLS